MQSIDLSQIMSGHIDVGIIICILIVGAKKTFPILRKGISIGESHLKCMEDMRDEIKMTKDEVKKMNASMSYLATKEDVHNLREGVLIDKLNGASRQLGNISNV